jgi:hypothetical protein
MFEKNLPMSFVDLQAHLLVHLPNEVELFEVRSCHFIFFLERYMKKMNGFVRQREKVEDSMEEGYIVYKSFYYANEYINQINDTTRSFIWDNHQDEDKREGELLQTNGHRCLIKSE